MTGPAFRHNRRAIYAAKRLVGKPVILCRTLSNSLDVKTGQQTTTIRSCLIKRAVVMPATSLRNFLYGHSFLQHNRSFAEGGFFDTNTRVVIVDRRDIPMDFVVDQKVHLIVEGKRMEAQAPITHEEMILFALTGLEYQVDDVEESVSDDFEVTDSAVDS